MQEQQRSGDPQHTIFVKHLSNGLPINIKHILNMKPLSFDDLKYDFHAWAFAPIDKRPTSKQIMIPLTPSKKGKEAIRYSFQPYEDSNNLCQLRIKQIFLMTLLLQ